MPSWFLPPAELVTAPKRKWHPTIRRHPVLRGMVDFLRGTTDGTPEGDAAGGHIIGGIVYRGGMWNGPLSPGQITAITAAGYAARIVEVDHVGLLPPGLD